MILNVYIPVRDRDNERIQRCVNSLRDNDINKIIKDICVIDYDSKIPIEATNCTIMRLVHQPIWNKAHALNYAITRTASEFIMTVDCDMIFDQDHLIEIFDHLSKRNFIYDTNVRRIKQEDISTDYESMIPKSLPWHQKDRGQLFNQANGGFQVYSRDFYNEINGIMETLGFYSGAMDNYMFFQARIHGLTTVDISYPLLHTEHEKQKDQNFDLDYEEWDMVQIFTQYKANYLDRMIKEDIGVNPETIGGDYPYIDGLNKFKEEYNNRDKIIQEAIDRGENEIDLLGQRLSISKAKPSILLTVINNYETMPSYFVWDLFNLYTHTKGIYPDIDIQHVNACDVNHMRNLAARCAMGDNSEKKVYDYLIMLDDDHRYPEDFIVKFVDLAEKTGWEIITGLTPSKKKPYLNTQYLKWMRPIDIKGNTVEAPEPKEEIIDIEASGPVGMLINTNVFKKIQFPYYQVLYDKDENGNSRLLGGDLYFSKQLLDNGIKIKCDLATNFPHCKSFFLSRGKVISN